MSEKFANVNLEENDEVVTDVPQDSVDETTLQKVKSGFKKHAKKIAIGIAIGLSVVGAVAVAICKSMANKDTDDIGDDTSNDLYVDDDSVDEPIE